MKDIFIIITINIIMIINLLTKIVGGMNGCFSYDPSTLDPVLDTLLNINWYFGHIAT